MDEGLYIIRSVKNCLMINYRYQWLAGQVLRIVPFRITTRRSRSLLLTLSEFIREFPRWGTEVTDIASRREGRKFREDIRELEYSFANGKLNTK